MLSRLNSAHLNEKSEFGNEKSSHQVKLTTTLFFLINALTLLSIRKLEVFGSQYAEILRATPYLIKIRACWGHLIQVISTFDIDLIGLSTFANAAFGLDEKRLTM